MISVAEAVNLVKLNSFSFKTEKTPLEEACGKVLAESVRADRDYPPFNRSAMDGYAVRSKEWSAGKSYKVAASVFAGDSSGSDFAEGVVLKIMTGAPVPAGFDAVIRVEDAEQEGDFVKFNIDAVRPGQNMAMQGEDLEKGTEALPAGVRINPAEITLLASLGMAEVLVYQTPKVVIISTGNEIKPVAEKVLPHQIRDSNSYTLAAFFQQMGIFSVERCLVQDDPEALRKRLEGAMGADVVILTGGVSMGDADYVPGTLVSLGVEKIFHKVKLKPGKPLWFGKKEGGPVVFGLPGNPFSCQVTFKLFIQPFLRACLGMEEIVPLYFKADFERNKKSGMEEYFPCRIIEHAGESLLSACVYNGSGDVTATAMSDGLACQPLESPSVKRGDLIAFYPWR